MTMRTLRFSFVLAGLGAALAASAQTALAPGGSVLVPQTLTSLTGTYLATTANVPFTGTDVMGDTVFTGTLTSVVSRQADGKLAFYYAFTNTGTATMDPIERFNVAGFAGFSTAVAQGTPDPLYVPASGASRTPGSGNVVSLNFAVGSTYGPVMPGQTSRFFVVFTDATSYKTGSAQFINGGIGNVATFVPQAVPEPASMAALGLGAVALIRRRRKG